MKKFNDELFEFIDSSNCAFTCVETIKNILIEQGYQQLYENEEWNLKSNKYFVIRNDHL